jgi:hypothetical protein
MDLFCVVLFLVMYYVRPQEWSPVFATIHFVQIVMLTALTLLFTRARGLKVADLFRTPHDWAVLAFWLWMVLTSTSPWDTFRDNANLYIFYIVIVQTLYSIPRIKVFVAWWMILIVFVAALAVASQHGFDPLGSKDLTDGYMKGRLALNLSILNNPNALGHSVVPALAMIYFYYIWKRPILVRGLGCLLLWLPVQCIFLTQSKGAFVSGAATVLATLSFGRPKTVQATIIGATLLFGTAALYSLPRMSELNKSRNDAAIQGRVAAYKHGYSLLQATTDGIGKGEWGGNFFSAHHYLKAPHSSYVCIGAELGKPGLYLFLGVLYCCLRTTMTARTENPDEERIRRMLFVLVVSYVVSSWMVDFEYRPTYFMFTAATAALHRHLFRLHEMPTAKEESAEPSIPVWQTALAPNPTLAGPQLSAWSAQPSMVIEPAPAFSEALSEPLPSRIGWNWNRLGWIDFLITGLITWGVIRYWAYLMTHM